MKNSTVYALYDFAIYPPQFDFITFMTQAKTAAQGRPLHVFFRPAEDGGYVNPAKYSKDHAIYRLIHICQPACALFGATSTVLPDRSTAWDIDGELLSGLNHIHEGIMRLWDIYGALEGPKATIQSRELVGRYVLRFDKPIVTITLRDTFRNKVKNSNKLAWFEFAERISDQFQPVFLPDTENAFDEWTMPFPTFNIGAVDLDSRLALYELAHMNCMSSNGPSVMCVWGDSPLLWFSQNVEETLDKEFLEKALCKVGEQPPYLNPRQKYIWDMDEVDIISNAFEEFA